MMKDGLPPGRCDGAPTSRPRHRPVETFPVHRLAPRRILILGIAAVIMAAGSGAAALTASADEFPGMAKPSSKIVAEHSDKCLTATGGSLVQRSCSQGDAMRQTFQITPAGAGYTIALLAGG